MSAALVERLNLEMNLRDPQADSLGKFHRLIESVDLRAQTQGQVRRMLEMGSLTFPDVYARLTFALATGVGKTRLMGAIMAYLFLTGKSRNFVLIAPSSTIYDKMKREASPRDARYIFGGLSGFPLPEVYYAENAEACRFDQPTLARAPRLFIFTPSQIRPRSGSEAERRLRREGETWGESFVTHLSKLPDLVVCLDEGHRYGGESWAQAVGDLSPKLAVEMTATPASQYTILHRYELREALREGKYIKNVVAIAEQRPTASNDWEWDRHTLEVALQRHKKKNSVLKAYQANQPEMPEVKPLTLVTCRDVSHAKQVEEWVESAECFKGEFRGKVLRVDNTQPKEEIVKLLEVEKADNPTEIVVYVGMLKEGWDVMNVYVVAPLRAMLGETLTTQTIGRGLRLPFGKRAGDEEVDTLDVLAFGRETVQEVIEAARDFGVTVREREKGEDEERVERTVAPLRKLTIPVPSIGVRLEEPPTLKGFSATPHHAPDPDANPTATRVTVGTGEASPIETVPLDIPNVPRRMGQELVRHFEELGGSRDEAEAERIFREYFDLVGCKGGEAIRGVQNWWGAIFDDVSNQVEALLQRVKLRYEQADEKGEYFEFGEVTYSIPALQGVIDKASADARQHRRTYLVGGWARSLYPEVRFDTEQELAVMKILDATKGVTWVRNPASARSGFRVQTAAGGHFPDFLVIEEERILLLEVKDSAELADAYSEACRKGKAATDWCNQATKSAGRKWEYVTVPHNLVERCATLEDLRHNRYVFPD